MNFQDIQKVVKHLQENCTCMHCKNKYEASEIQILATTKHEGLFEINCKKCGSGTIVTIVMTPANAKERKAEIVQTDNRIHRKISQDDILDIKNFLINFNGDFKEIFEKSL